MTGSKYEVLRERVSQLEEQTDRQMRINKSALNAFQQGGAALEEMNDALCFLENVVAGLALVCAGLGVGLLKNKRDLWAIQKAMNEG